MLPMRLSFEFQTSEHIFYFEIMVDWMFIIDIFLNFNTGFHKNGILYMTRAAIIKDYLEMWFWLDLLSSMPYTWILAYSQGLTIRQIEADDEETMISGALASAPSLLRLLKIAKLLKMLKLLRVVKIKKILMKFEEYIVTDSMNLLVTFCNLTVKIIVTAHYMGCAFYFVGMENWKSDGRGWIVEK